MVFICPVYVLALTVLMPFLDIYPKNKDYVCGILLHVRSFICHTQTPVHK